MPDAIDLDIPKLVHGFLEDLMQTCSASLPTTDFDWYETERSEAFQMDRINDMIHLQTFDNEITEIAAKLSRERDVTFTSLPTLRRRQLLDGVARAKREAILYQQHIREQPFSKYEYHDLDLVPSEAQLASIANHNPTPVAQNKPISSFLQTYLNSDAHGWTEATRNEKRIPLAWFEEQVGPNRDIRKIAPADILAFRDAMMNLRKHVTAGTPLSEAQSDVLAKRIHARTARKKFDTVMTFMRWLHALGEIDHVPANGISLKVPKTPKGDQRRPFQPNELDQLFTSPLYSGCKSLARRSKPGGVVHLDDEYWMPLVLMYTGMRISEPLQLAANDIHVDAPHPYVKLDGSKLKLKSAAADRIVPLHPDLEDFGFFDFVRRRIKGGPTQRLFRGITSNGDLSGYYSKKIGKYLSSVGLDDPRLVAHSFRHGFKTALRNAAVPEGEQHFLMGHSDNSTAHGYGVASDVEVLHGWVANLKFGWTDSTRRLLLSNRKKGPAK